MTERVDCVVVGAGVVGLAVARSLALAGREVIVLEAKGVVGSGTSSRNSEVIHAGIYYPHGSLKAMMCTCGKRLLYDYCEVRNVDHRRCGKLIVATSDAQVAQLDAIAKAARANGVDDLRRIGGVEACEMEPAVNCKAALVSPSTGIIDSHALMLALQADLESAGGAVARASPLVAALSAEGQILLRTDDGTELWADCVVNSAGIAAPALATRFQGLDGRHVPAAYYAKGNFHSDRAGPVRASYLPCAGGGGARRSYDARPQRAG